MKVLVIGLGSMGKRRIRCLKKLGISEIAGFDVRKDRLEEAKLKYNITTFFDLNKGLNEFKPDIFIISVPPDKHHIYMNYASNNKIDFFVEASVVDEGMDEIIKKVNKHKIIAAPSATMLFHPAIQKIIELIKNKNLGKISNIIYHSGQYLPDWHTYEAVNEYYVSNPITGGAREIVPFELTWLIHLFGFPDKIFSFYRKTIDIIGAEKIDDTYNLLFEYRDFLTNITIDVVSRFATRRLLINGDQKQLIWDWNLNNIQIYDPSRSFWEIIKYGMSNAESGYNPNIGENMYVSEIEGFIQSVKNRQPFVNTLENDKKILKLLYLAEESYHQSKAL